MDDFYVHLKTLFLLICLSFTKADDHLGMCGDPFCTVPIGEGVTVSQYHAPDNAKLSFGVNRRFVIYVRRAGKRRDYLGVVMGDKRGYVPTGLVKEEKSLIPTEKLFPAKLDFLHHQWPYSQSSDYEDHFSETQAMHASPHFHQIHSSGVEFQSQSPQMSPDNWPQQTESQLSSQWHEGAESYHSVDPLSSQFQNDRTHSSSFGVDPHGYAIDPSGFNSQNFPGKDLSSSYDGNLQGSIDPSGYNSQNFPGVDHSNSYDPNLQGSSVDPSRFNSQNFPGKDHISGYDGNLQGSIDPSGYNYQNFPGVDHSNSYDNNLQGSSVDPSRFNSQNLPGKDDSSDYINSQVSSMDQSGYNSQDLPGKDYSSSYDVNPQDSIDPSGYNSPNFPQKDISSSFDVNLQDSSIQPSGPNQQNFFGHDFSSSYDGSQASNPSGYRDLGASSSVNKPGPFSKDQFGTLGGLHPGISDNSMPSGQLGDFQFEGEELDQDYMNTLRMLHEQGLMESFEETYEHPGGGYTELESSFPTNKKMVGTDSWASSTVDTKGASVAEEDDETDIQEEEMEYLLPFGGESSKPENKNSETDISSFHPKIPISKSENVVSEPSTHNSHGGVPIAKTEIPNSESDIQSPILEIQSSKTEILLSKSEITSSSFKISESEVMDSVPNVVDSHVKVAKTEVLTPEQEKISSNLETPNSKILNSENIDLVKIQPSHLKPDDTHFITKSNIANMKSVSSVMPSHSTNPKNSESHQLGLSSSSSSLNDLSKTTHLESSMSDVSKTTHLESSTSDSSKTVPLELSTSDSSKTVPLELSSSDSSKTVPLELSSSDSSKTVPLELSSSDSSKTVPLELSSSDSSKTVPLESSSSDPSKSVPLESSLSDFTEDGLKEELERIEIQHRDMRPLRSELNSSALEEEVSDFFQSRSLKEQSNGSADDQNLEESTERDFFGSVENFLESIRSFVEVIISWVPEPLHGLLLDVKQGGLSPRVPVFTLLVSLPCLLLLLTLVFIKEKSKEKKLTALLALSEKQLYELAAQKNILEEKIEKTSEELKSSSSTLDSERTSFESLQAEVKSLKKKLQERSSDLEERETEVEELREQEAKTAEQLAENERAHEALMLEKSHMENKVLELEEFICTLKSDITERDMRVESLEKEQLEQLRLVKESEDRLNQLQQNCSQLLKEAEVWDIRVKELTSQLGEMTTEKEELQETLSAKDNEIQSLTHLVQTLKSFEETTDDTKSNEERLSELLNATSLLIKLENQEQENKALSEKLATEKNKVIEMDVELLESRSESEKLRMSYTQALQDRAEAQTKLQVLTNYFKDKEIQMQREIGAQEAVRERREKDADSAERRILLIEQENTSYKCQVASMKQEIDETERTLKNQIALQEKKAHENWIAARAAERKLEDMKQEMSQLRQRLTLMEQEATAAREDALRPPPKRHLNEDSGEPPHPPFPLPPMLLPLDRPMPPIPPHMLPPMELFRPPFRGRDSPEHYPHQSSPLMRDPTPPHDFQDRPPPPPFFSPPRMRFPPPPPMWPPPQRKPDDSSSIRSHHSSSENWPQTNSRV